jgi:hypothetical protein
MTGAERQRRYIARQVKQAASSTPTLDGPVIKLAHLAIDPLRTARFVRMKLGDNDTRRIRDAFDQVLNEAGPERAELSL